MNRLQLARFTIALKPLYTEAPSVWRSCEETRKYTDGHSTYRVVSPLRLKSIVELRQLSKVDLVHAIVDTCLRRLLVTQENCLSSKSGEVECLGELLVRERDLTVTELRACAAKWDIELLRVAANTCKLWAKIHSSWVFAVLEAIFRDQLVREESWLLHHRAEVPYGTQH